jgi:hypothetical protein
MNECSWYFFLVMAFPGREQWTNEWMNEWMNEWTKEWMNEWTNKWMKEWMNESINEYMNIPGLFPSPSCFRLWRAPCVKVWQGVALVLLNYHLGPACPTLLRPSGMPPLKQCNDRLMDDLPRGRRVYSHLLPLWTPHTVCLWPLTGWPQVES